MNKSNKFSPEVRERAVRMVQEHRGEYPSLWAAVESIAPKIGCVPQTLLEWVKRQEVDSGVREGVTTTEAQRVKDLEREVKELRRANEILKLASAFFAQAELDRRLKSCGLHRSAPGRPRGRADLHGPAGCPVGLQTPCCAAEGS
jgi:transposase-like protein